MNNQALCDASAAALRQVADRNPLVHTITNFVTVNDCANIILAAGGSPTMAHDPREVEEIAAVSQAVVLNMGAIEDLDAMILAAKAANRRGIPVVLDPVAAGASRLRRESCAALTGQVSLTVVRGNASEIKALAVGSSSTRGVDVGSADVITEKTLPAAVSMAKDLSHRLGAVIAVSGVIDIIADRDRVCLVRNGCAEMSRITGSGCMLTALLGAFCGANPDRPFEASVAAVGTMGYAGELARERTIRLGGGNATFRTCLIDAVSLMTPEQLKGGLNIEGF
ncbi:MAG: hydroxyethylthiazole kinase [Oscillospiraceae bacterium]|nr:MAG: hydroxyethylthiazole kinase [Oscillospiraceae bacterium]